MSKFGSKKTLRLVNGDNVYFDSLKEARRFDELFLLAKSGIISDLIIQPSFLLMPPQQHNGVSYRATSYVADFSYIKNGKKIVEDVKSEYTKKLPVYRVKVKWFLSLYGNDVVFMES